jgi:N-acetylglutamate synthase-like GNAT family acetyltransferase
MKIKKLANAELERLTAINREERVRQAYVVKDGALEVQEVDWNVPDWPMDGPDDFSWRGNFKKWKTLLDEGSIVLCAMEGEALVGFAILRPKLTDSMAQLAELHVSRGHRGQGVGAQLIEEVFRRAKAQGATDIYVSSIPTKNSVDFYRRRGFKLAEEVHPELFELEPEDIHMVRAL